MIYDGPVLNQRQSPACMGFSCATALAAINDLTRSGATSLAQNIYLFMMSDQQGMASGGRYAVENDLADSYETLATADALRAWVRHRGPAACALTYDLKVGGSWATFARREFDHAVAIVGYSKGKEAFRLRNSWGTDWGDGGEVWIEESDLSRCIALAQHPTYVVGLEGHLSDVSSRS